MCSLARPWRLMASMPLYDIIVIHCGIVPTSLIAASCRLDCCMSSSCDFHIVLYLYSGIRYHSHTPVGLCCYESSMRPYKVFLAAALPTLIAASCQLYLRHYCRLNSSSHRTTCVIFIILNDIGGVQGLYPSKSLQPPTKEPAKASKPPIEKRREAASG
jgi:hypothetical protein